MNKLEVTGGHLVELKSELPERYLCALCNLLLRDAIQTAHGTLVCELCYNRRLRVNPTVSPVDGEPLVDGLSVFPDKYTRNTILQLQCYCNNKKHGCTWEGTVQDSEDHLIKCEFVPVKGNECDELQNHTASSNCKQEVEAISVEEHEIKCIKKPSECPYKCSYNVDLNEFTEHITKCPQIEQATICPYSLIGCNEKVNGEPSLEKHLLDYKLKHAALAVSNLEMTLKENESLKVEVENVKKHNERLASRVEELWENQKQVETVLSDFNSKIPAIEKKLDEIQLLDEAQGKSIDAITSEQEGGEKTTIPIQATLNTLQSHYADYEEKIQELYPYVHADRRIEANAATIRNDIMGCNSALERMETNQTVFATQLANLELKLQLFENTTHGGKQLWKIDNIRHRRHQAVTGKITALHSPPCFSERCAGYKFCARLYLDGDGMGKGTHVSIYFVMMRSSHDELLEWPFNYIITFHLIHPKDRKKSIKESFIPDPNSSSFQRPARDMNMAAGCPRFIKKEKLFNDGYIVDDSIFIEFLATKQQSPSNEICRNS